MGSGGQLVGMEVGKGEGGKGMGWRSVGLGGWMRVYRGWGSVWQGVSRGKEVG